MEAVRPDQTKPIQDRADIAGLAGRGQPSASASAASGCRVAPRGFAVFHGARLGKWESESGSVMSEQREI